MSLEPRRVALVGGGVIGAGWAARVLLNGHDATIYDPDPELGRKLDEVLGNARRAQAKLFPGLALPEGRLTLAPTLAEAVADADLVIESLPENEALKIRVLGEIDAAAQPDAIVSSSTSGLLPSRLQAGMAHPERFVVGHPFNPVYLLPLVEICGGERTAPDTKAAASTFFESLGMRALDVRQEVDGFIADRLLEALWREALWLVNDGIATTEEIDDAVRFGAGLRWAFMGTFLTYRVAGGEAGMRHFLAQFGPALKLPWTKLEAPELTQVLIDRVAAQSDEQAAGTSIRDLERKRDDCLVAVLGGLRGQGYGAGTVLKNYERSLVSRLASAAPPAHVDETAPLRLYRTRVQPDWIDYNGHMTEHRYLQCFGEATDALLRHIGLDGDYLASSRSFFTVESHLMHRGQARLDDPLAATTQVLAQDPKRLHIFHILTRETDGAVMATAEHMLLHVDTRTDKVLPAEGPVLAATERLGRLHAALPKPPEAGRQVGRR